MSIDKLNNNIKNCKYKNVFTSKDLHSKYISFCELDKGKYYATLDLTKLIRVNSDDKLINEDDNDSFDQIISKIVSNNNYKIYIKNILDLLEGDDLSEDEKQITMLICVHNNIFENNIDHKDIKNLQKISNDNDVEQLLVLCKYFNMSSRTYYYKKKSVLKKIYNLLNEMMENHV
jgi:hypothetical protein